MTVTIKDIAKIARVSHTTVSRALNNSPLIKEDTRERIKAIAKELNYTPNFNAKSLVLDRSYHIGLFFSTISQGTSSHFFHEVVKGVNNVIKDQFNMVVKGIDDYHDFNSITRKNFDGLIVMSQSAKDDDFINDVLTKKIPLVVLNRQVEKENLVNILSDDKRGAYRAVMELINGGHERIALIEGKEGFKSSQERREGYIDALRDSKIPIEGNFIVKGSYDLESGYQAMLRLLKEPQLPTGVFCSNDDMAVGAMKAIRERGMLIPEDISLIGFDDNIFSAYLTPALTTIKRPIEKISQKGAQKLLELIKGSTTKTETLYLKTELIKRDSITNIPR
ncbi:LacI family DNA-binding transcriptional regulator [Alkaliphilus crotonatoxidans]